MQMREREWQNKIQDCTSKTAFVISVKSYNNYAKRLSKPAVYSVGLPLNKWIDSHLPSAWNCSMVGKLCGGWRKWVWLLKWRWGDEFYCATRGKRKIMHICIIQLAISLCCVDCSSFKEYKLRVLFLSEFLKRSVSRGGIKCENAKTTTLNKP